MSGGGEVAGEVGDIGADELRYIIIVLPLHCITFHKQCEALSGLARRDNLRVQPFLRFFLF